jgi:PAS domain S-box-containing protein
MESDQVKKSEKNIKGRHGEIVELHGTQPDIAKRKSAQQSRKNWEITFNAMSEWVVLIDLEGRILRTNRAGESFTGKSSTEIVGQTCCKLVHGSDKHLPGCPLHRMLETRQHESIEFLIQDTDRWLMVSTDPVINTEGKLVGAVHVTRDISERKKAEKTIQENEERYRHIFEQSPLGIGLATADGKVVRTNKAMEVITGYFEEELKKINLAETYENPEDRKKLLETIKRYGCAVDFHVRMKRKNGTAYDALLNVSRVRFNGRELFQTICIDVTERKKTQEALRESEEMFRSIFETSLIGVAICSTDKKWLYMNDQICKILGYSEQELRQTTWDKLTHPDDLETDISQFNRLLEG